LGESHLTLTKLSQDQQQLKTKGTRRAHDNPHGVLQIMNSPGNSHQNLNPVLCLRFPQTKTIELDQTTSENCSLRHHNGSQILSLFVGGEVFRQGDSFLKKLRVLLEIGRNLTNVNNH
jgi:hypothetical protein